MRSITNRSFRLLVAVLTVCAPDLWAESERIAPYDIEAFRPVLMGSKLQAPTSKTLIGMGDFEGEFNEYFYAEPTGPYLTFTVSGDSKRSEIRQMTGDWQTSTSSLRRLFGEARVFYPADISMNQFTFMQIHDTTNDPQSLNKPLLRLVWLRSRDGLDDHLWAAIRTPRDASQPISLDNLAGKFVDLGPRPEGFFASEVRVQHNQMRVLIEGQEKLSMDVSYWDGLNNYFKAGVYNQDPGTSKVQFKSLTYDPSPQAIDIDQKEAAGGS